MKKLCFIAMLVMVTCIFAIPCMCFANAAGSYSLSNIYVTMTNPEIGKVAPTDLSAGNNLTIQNVVWKDSKGSALSSSDKISGGTYTLSFDIARKAGDRIAARTSVYINNSAEGVEKSNVSSDSMTVTKSYSFRATSSGRLSNATGKAQYLDEASYKPVSSIVATIGWPKEGEVLDQNPKMDDTEGAIVLGVVWSYRDANGKYVEITDKEYKAVAGVSYIASILFKFDVGYKLDPDCKSGKVNSNEPCEVTNTNGNCCITSLSMGIRSSTGSSAARPSTSTSTNTRPTTGTTVTRPTTGTTVTRPSTSTSTDDSSDIPGKVDTAVIAEIIDALKSGDNTVTLASGDLVNPATVKPIEQRPIIKKSGDNLTTVSGEQETSKEPAKEPEKEPETKPVEEVKEEVQTIVWAEASGWALDELTKANNAGLIPQIFDKQSLKSNITRKEFAHVAVKLCEKLTGKKAEPVSKNPFTDTNDSEVLKAYKLGITKGVTETQFSPDALIIREEMATMMARALEAAGIDVSVDLTKVKEFSDDKEMHNWSRNAIYFMSNIEIIKGMGDNRFGVKENASREQSIIISVRSAEKFAK